MTDLFEKSIQTLELPKVLEKLADLAATQEGKERCLALRPCTDADDVQRALDETSAAVQMTALRGSPSFAGVRPVAASLQRAQMGGALNTRELLDIAAVLRAARSARDYGEGEGDRAKTCIDHLFRSLTANRFLEDKITGSILAEDEIADAASPELASIRRHIRATASKVRDILNKLISSNQAKYLQEAIITQRNDRYVVPVKSEHKNDVPGLVHDVSSSGSTFFIEPMGVVKANNELRELQSREEKEIERILAELSAECAQFQADIAQDYDLLILLDVIFAKAQLSYRMRACAPRLSNRGMYLRKARHPLLDPNKAVANDLMLGGGLRHPGDHRPQHRRQDGHPQDHGPAHPHGPVRPAHPRGGRQPGQGVCAGAGRRGGRAVHRPESVHLLLPHGEHRGHAAGDRRGHPDPL